jgi:DNA polymerase III subunit delta
MIPKSLVSALGKEKGGVFYLSGSDEVRKESAARALVEAHLDPATRDFNFDILRGSDLDVETIASVLGTPPMMAEWRVVLLRETQALASQPKARSLLLKVAESPPPGLALIAIATEPSQAQFYKSLRKAARSVEFRTPGASDLPAWLMAWSRETLDREIEEAAARALAQAVGGDSGILAQELEKLAAFVGEGEPITLAAVEAAGTRIPRQDRWQWLDRVGEGRFHEALSGLHILFDQGESGVALTSALGSHFLRLGLVAAGGGRALSGILPGNQQFLVQRYVAQARRWTSDEVEGALRGLLRVDRRLKSGGSSERQVLEEWVLERMVSREAAA